MHLKPISNQGESLGKANLVLQKNLLGKLDASQVQKVEKCAVNYVRPKWFYRTVILENREAIRRFLSLYGL